MIDTHRIVAGMALIGVLTAAAPAQTAAPADRTLAPVSDTGPIAPLLRERSYLTDLTGQLVVDEATGWWRFTVDDETSSVASLIMLPNRKLDEMQQVVRASPDQRSVFRVTGQVFVYRGRNFLLPTHAPQLVEFEAESPEVSAEPETGDDPDLQDALDEQVAEEDEGDTVEDIMRELASATGTLLRSPGASQPETIDDATTPPAHEGLIMIERRGNLTRTERGAWTFVFDADAEGLADPPLVILPCLLLERMEGHATRAGRSTAILLSGQVYHYRGRRFVLPTVFRVPYERTRLNP